LLLVALEHMKKTVSDRDAVLRLRARLRDLRGEFLG